MNTRVFINTRRKCSASAYKRTVIIKWAAIYKPLAIVNVYYLHEKDVSIAINYY